MKLRPRSILCFFSLISIFVCLPEVALAQKSRTQAAQKKQSREETRRAKAIALIAETAERARSFDDLFYRARVQALAADALWPYDRENARAIFRRAWDAATAWDKAEQEEAAREDASSSESNSDSNSTLKQTALAFTEARDEVLAKAAGRDAQLVRIFLREMLADKAYKVDEKNAGENVETGQTAKRSPWGELSEGGRRRLALAYEMMYQGNPERAAEIAAPAIGEGMSGELIVFLLQLRTQNAAAFAGLYARLLEKAGAQALISVNEILLLSTPIVSPDLLVVMDASGGLQFRPVSYNRFALSDTRAHTSVEKDVRGAFFQLAATTLLRSPSSRDGNATTEAVALYFAIGRLLPFFEREAAQFAPELRARLSTLSSEIEANRLEQVTAQQSIQRLTPLNQTDPLGSWIAGLDRAQNEGERERILIQIVMAAARQRLWDRAREFADKLEDLNARQSALSFITASRIADISNAYEKDSEEDFEGFAKFVRTADVPPVTKALGYAQTAMIASRTGAAKRALELLDMAEREAARTQAGTEQRASAYALIMATAAHVDKNRAWEFLAELVRAANALEDFHGDEIALEIQIGDSATDESATTVRIEPKAFHLDEIFATMAQIDFDRALAEARALGKDVPRSLASLAVARTALEGKTVRSQ
ncbi:MAG: hypothetical protein WBP93_04265 [Pyrinomonadaceae bacterium]